MLTHLILGWFEEELVFGLEEAAYASIIYTANPPDCLCRSDERQTVLSAFCEVLCDRSVRAKVKILYFIKNDNAWSFFVTEAAYEGVQIP